MAYPYAQYPVDGESPLEPEIDVAKRVLDSVTVGHVPGGTKGLKGRAFFQDVNLKIVKS